MRGFEHGNGIRNIRTRCNTNTTNLGSQCIRDVVTIQIQCGNNIIVFRTQQYLLQHGIGNDVLDDDLVTAFWIPERTPWPPVDFLGSKFFFSQFITPLLECTFREFHDVALVHQGDGRLVIINGVLDSFAHQSLCALAGYGFYADPRRFGKTNLGHTHFVLQETDHFQHFGVIHRHRLKRHQNKNRSE